MATKIINWFVDRTKQCQFFLERMVSRATTKQILLVQAPTEMGKTWLIQKLRYECDARKIPVAQLDFRDGRAWDFLALVREVREQMGPEHFNELTSVINESTSIKLEVPAAKEEQALTQFTSYLTTLVSNHRYTNRYKPGK